MSTSSSVNIEKMPWSRDITQALTITARSRYKWPKAQRATARSHLQSFASLQAGSDA